MPVPFTKTEDRRKDAGDMCVETHVELRGPGLAGTCVGLISEQIVSEASGVEELFRSGHEE